MRYCATPRPWRSANSSAVGMIVCSAWESPTTTTAGSVARPIGTVVPAAILPSGASGREDDQRRY